MNETTQEELETILLNAPKITHSACRYGLFFQIPENKNDEAVLQRGWYTPEARMNGHFRLSGNKKGKEYAQYIGSPTDKRFKSLFDRIVEKYQKQERRK